MNVEILERVAYTLGTITISGKDNMDKLLGCINALESFIKVAKVQQFETLESKEESNG